MLSKVYDKDADLDLDLDRNLKAAAVWSTGVEKATDGLCDLDAYPKWAPVLAFGTPSRPELCLSRARFASRVLELHKQGAVDLSQAKVPSSSFSVKETKSEGRTQYHVSFRMGEDGYSDEESDALEFYRASFLAYSAYFAVMTVDRASKMPVEFSAGWEDKKAEVIGNVRSSFEPVASMACAFVSEFLRNHPAPDNVVAPDMARHDKEFMGLFGIIRKCVNILYQG